MIHALTRWISLALASTLCVSSQLGAQNAVIPDTAAVRPLPADLAYALLGTYIMEPMARSKFFVDELPTAFPASILPPGPVKILGGLSSGSQHVVILADSTRRLESVILQSLVERGWDRPRPSTTSGFAGSGSTIDRHVCGDSGSIDVETLAPLSRGLVRIRYQTNVPRSSCSPPPYPAEEVPSVLKLPVLTPPAGGYASQYGGGRREPSEVSSIARLDGAALKAAAVAEHYMGMLRAAGWKATALTGDFRVSMKVLDATDAAGHGWTGLLTVFERANGVDVNLVMRPVAK